jgi:hypothetical protein
MTNKNTKDATLHSFVFLNKMIYVLTLGFPCLGPLEKKNIKEHYVNS